MFVIREKIYAHPVYIFSNHVPAEWARHSFVANRKDGIYRKWLHKYITLIISNVTYRSVVSASSVCKANFGEYMELSAVVPRCLKQDNRDCFRYIINNGPNIYRMCPGVDEDFSWVQIHLPSIKDLPDTCIP